MRVSVDRKLAVCKFLLSLSVCSWLDSGTLHMGRNLSGADSSFPCPVHAIRWCIVSYRCPSAHIVVDVLPWHTNRIFCLIVSQSVLTCSASSHDVHAIKLFDPVRARSQLRWRSILSPVYTCLCRGAFRQSHATGRQSAKILATSAHTFPLRPPANSSPCTSL